MSHEDQSFTEPVLKIEGIEPVIAHYESLFDNIRKDATEQIRINVSSAVDNLFDVYVDYMKTITTKAYSVANNQQIGEKYVPLSLVESGARVMHAKLRQLMSSEIDTTSSKLSQLLKAPLHLPLNQNSNNDDDDDDDQQDSDDADAILDQLEKNLEDISDVDGDENDDENGDENKRKRNKQKRQTELKCEKIAQMSMLIRKLERYQLAEQTMLLRRLEKQKKQKINRQPKQQLVHQETTSSNSASISDLVNNNEQSHQSSNETSDLAQLPQFEPTEQLAQSPVSCSTSSVVHNYPNLISPAPNPAQLQVIQPAPNVCLLVQPQSNVPITTQQHLTSTNQSGTDQVARYFVRSANPLFSPTCTTPVILQGVMNNSSIIVTQVSNASNLLSPSLTLSNSDALSEQVQNVNCESDDEVVFLEEVNFAANRTNQNVGDEDVSAQESPQPVHEQTGGNVYQSALVSKRTLMEEHLLSFHHKLPYNCFLSCGEKFATLEGLNAHLTEQHPEIKVFSCMRRCKSNQFKSYTDLFLHYDNHHSQLGVCGCTESNCWFKVGWSDVLEAAKRSFCLVNSAYSSVLCPIRGCGKNLSSFISARDHLVIHREDRPFVCSRCTATFKRKKYCLQHIRTHFTGREFTPEQVNNYLQVCDPLHEQPFQLMDNLFIQLTSETTATIVSIKPIQAPVHVASTSASTPSLSLEHENFDSIQGIENMLDPVETNVSRVASPIVASSSFPTTSTANSLNNSGKRILVTSDETGRPSKIPKFSDEAPVAQSQDNATVVTSQAPPQASGQLKPTNLHCAYCSDRFESRATLNSHILTNHKCSKLQTRLFICAFVGCSASRSNKQSVQSHVAAIHHQTTGDSCEYFDILDK